MSRVALIGENSVEYIEKLLDIWNDNNCAVLIDCQIPVLTAIDMMNEAQVDTCYIEKKYYDKMLTVQNGTIKLISYEKESNSAQLLPPEIYEKFKKNYSRDEAIVIYSSGTTGKSKGIILSHFAVNTNADAIIDYLQLYDNDCMYIVKNITHSSVIIGELLVALKTGTPILISPVIVPPRIILQNIEKYQVTQISVNPTILKLLYDECRRKAFNIKSLRNIYVNGAKTHDKLGEAVKKFFAEINIYFEYGLTEAGPRVTSQKISDSSNSSVGKAISGVEIVLVDETGKVVDTNTKGIIHVKTPSLYSGYVCGGNKLPSLYNNWLNTGDVGYFDSIGELYIVGRKDDMLNINAHKIYPVEVEKQIQIYTDVYECVVTAVNLNGEEVLCCLYVSDDEIRKDIKYVLSTVLMKYEIPKLFIRKSSIPKTRNGKIAMYEVKSIIQCECEESKQVN